VVLVTKDVNLRILAAAKGVKAEDYRKDRVDPNDVPSGVHERVLTDPDALQPFYGADPPDVIDGVNLAGVRPNEFIKFSEVDGSHRLFRWTGSALRTIGKWRLKFDARNDGQRMALDLLMDPKVSLVVLLGAAGTGKTLMALMAGVSQLDRQYDKIILSKPVVPMGRDLGFLPGSEAEKLHPWMMSFFDNLDQLFATDKKDNARKGVKEKNWEQLVQSGQVEIQPMHSIRGRSIPRAFMLFDEIQNATPHEVKTVVSRAATGTKVVLCGDPSQIDDPFLDAFSNGLVHAAKATRESPLAGAVYLGEGVRSPLADLAAKLM
jgi:PhoH-like ATPase